MLSDLVKNLEAYITTNDFLTYEYWNVKLLTPFNFSPNFYIKEFIYILLVGETVQARAYLNISV